jgi:RHS repeat-associated protein
MEREGGHGNVDTGTGYLIEELSDRVSGTAYGWGLDRSGGTVESDVYQRTYLWNEENRLIQSQDNNLTVQYRYNADGDRSHKYSDRGESLYFDSLYSSASTGDIDRMRDSIHIYLGQTRIATRLKMDDSSDYEYSRLNTYYYHSDHLGSAQLVTDYAGEEYEHMEYTPYGELWLERNRDGSDLIPFRFTGKEFDTETNLYYYGARYMDPRTSRWISSDPAGAMLAGPMGDDGKPRSNFSIIESMNHYSYVSNNPVKYVDPTGMYLLQTRRSFNNFHMGSADILWNDIGPINLGISKTPVSQAGCFATAYAREANAWQAFKLEGNGVEISHNAPVWANNFAATFAPSQNFSSQPGQEDLILRSTRVSLFTGIMGESPTTGFFEGTDTIRAAMQAAINSENPYTIIGVVASASGGIHALNIEGFDQETDMVTVYDTYEGNTTRYQISIDELLNIRTMTVNPED